MPNASLPWLVAAFMLLGITGCAQVAQPRQDAPELGGMPNWEGGSKSHTDSTGVTWTYPADISRNPDHGCVTWHGGDGIVRTVCW